MCEGFIDSLTNVVVEETVCTEDGSPMLPSEAVDELTGCLHKDISKLLLTSQEVRIGFDGVRVKRYLYVSELRALAAKTTNEGGS